MSRIVVIGLTALIVTACGPADQTPTAETTAPAEPASAPQPSAPMSWEAMQDHYRQMEVEPTDPLEALEMRAVLCTHFSQEIGSGDPERERYLSAQIDKYRCEEALLADVQAMRGARSDEPAVVARLNTISEGLPY